MNTFVNEENNETTNDQDTHDELNGCSDPMSGDSYDVLKVRRLPAMLTVSQTAVLLGRREHDIPVLVRAGILKPLGNAQRNSVKFFATIDVLEMAGDHRTLNRICSVLSERWRKRNQSRARTPD